MNWIDDIVGKTLQNYNGRKVVIWGYNAASKDIVVELQNYNIEFGFYVEDKADYIDGRVVKSFEEIYGKANEYYLVVTMGYFDERKKHIERGGYRADKDYYYFCDCIVVQSDEYFEDAHGNRIFGYYGGMIFSFLGWNATIEIESGAYIKDTYVYIHNQSVLKIGAKTELIECYFSLWDEASLKIDKGVFIKKGRYDIESNSIVDLGESCHLGINGGVTLRKNSSLFIGARTSVGKNHTIGIGSDTKCVIGKDCMIANDICLRTNDGHSIFDVESQTVINYSGKDKDAEIKIGNHVWIGMRATILYNTNIGDGSIVGACSLVKCKTPNNVLLFGTPAKIKRKNIAWSRANQVDNIFYCGEENIKLTGSMDNDN